jgi:hypothetical protein
LAEIASVFRAGVTSLSLFVEIPDPETASAAYEVEKIINHKRKTVKTNAKHAVIQRHFGIARPIANISLWFFKRPFYPARYYC